MYKQSRKIVVAPGGNESLFRFVRLFTAVTAPYGHPLAVPVLRAALGPLTSSRPDEQTYCTCAIEQSLFPRRDVHSAFAFFVFLPRLQRDPDHPSRGALGAS